MIRAALAGNQNTGKTTLFNLLTGMNQYVGNWPGVTVEKKEGRVTGVDMTVVDLPGVYSLSPYTSEEIVSRNYLLNEKPDVIINIVDATNIERNLYLTTQLMEIGIPVVIALNMMDVVVKRGDRIDVDGLSKALKCRVCEISALKGTGIKELIETAVDEGGKEGYVPPHIFSGVTEHAVAHIEEAVLHSMNEKSQRWFSIKLFERDAEVQKMLGISDEKLLHIENDIKAAEAEKGEDAQSIITNERYDYIAKVLSSCYSKKSLDFASVSAKIDGVVTSRAFALPIFALVIFLVYFISVSLVGRFITPWIDEGIFGKGWYFGRFFIPGISAFLTKLLNTAGCNPLLVDLIEHGITEGVGSVLSFVPQLFVLFFFLSFLELCGYMSRIAFILDRFFHTFGLSGKSFIPLLVGTGCGVPGIMSSRTIENISDRRMTVITTTFMPCSAKLPVIALISSYFFGGTWWVAPLCYFIGILSVILSGIMLKKFRAFKSEYTPFVLELPDYHLPSAHTIYLSVRERVGSFIKKAGTVIFLSSIAVWFLSHFGYYDGHFYLGLDIPLEKSLIGLIGFFLSWIFKPLGFGNIRASVATLLGLVAKEEIVSVTQILGGPSALGLTKAGAFSFLVFNLLCAPCIAAMNAIKREMNDVRWTVFAIFYQCAYAYFIAFMINQFALYFSGSVHGFCRSAAWALLIPFINLLVRKGEK